MDKNKFREKSPLVYYILIVLFALVTAYLTYFFIDYLLSAKFANLASTFAKVMVAILMFINLTTMFITWTAGFRDLIFFLIYCFNNKKYLKYYDYMDKLELTINPRVIVLFCYYNEFDEFALRKSIKQDYNNVEFVLLDDSNKENIKQQIDATVEKLKNKGYAISVVRRDNRNGFKAGALNQYLRSRDDYEYFAVCDCDEVLCEDFVTKSLKYFQDDEEVGGVQARHQPRNQGNAFADGVQNSIRMSHNVLNMSREKFGQNTFMGHGMMLSKKSFNKVGGFPELVVEDAAMSLKYVIDQIKIVFAYNIVCYENIAIDFLAYKKQQIRWAQGDIELLKKGFFHKVFTSKSPWFKKLDIWITFRVAKFYSPLSAFILLFTTVIMWQLGVLTIDYGIVFGVFGSIGILAYALSFITGCLGKVSFWGIVYSALLFLVCIAAFSPSYMGNVLLCTFGKKPYFTVTSKTSTKYSFFQAIKYNSLTILFVGILFALTWIFCGTPLPALVMFVYALATIFITLLSNIQTKSVEKQVINI